MFHADSVKEFKLSRYAAKEIEIEGWEPRTRKKGNKAGNRMFLVKAINQRKDSRNWNVLNFPLIDHKIYKEKNLKR